MPRQIFDLAVVGGSILGLAHAWAAARAGKRGALFERDARANGASIRNFGLIAVTGQERAESWRWPAVPGISGPNWRLRRAS